MSIQSTTHHDFLSVAWDQLDGICKIADAGLPEEFTPLWNIVTDLAQQFKEISAAQDEVPDHVQKDLDRIWIDLKTATNNILTKGSAGLARGTGPTSLASFGAAPCLRTTLKPPIITTWRNLGSPVTPCSENAGVGEDFLLELAQDLDEVGMKKEHLPDALEGATSKGPEPSRKDLEEQKVVSVALQTVILFAGASWLLENAAAKPKSDGESATCPSNPAA